jgi:hypothetical protein
MKNGEDFWEFDADNSSDGKKTGFSMAKMKRAGS